MRSEPTALRAVSETWNALRTLAAALAAPGAGDAEALARMGLAGSGGIGARIQARLVTHALARTRAPAAR